MRSPLAQLPLLRRARCSGLTFPELIAALAVTGLIAMAIAAFSMAASTGWTASKRSAALGSTASRSAAQLEAIVRSCHAIAQAKPPDANDASSYAFLWRDDDFGGTADGAAQAGEMLLVEYDPAAQTVWLYVPRGEADLSPGDRAVAAEANWGDIRSAAAVDFFRSANFVEPRRALIGPGDDRASRAPRVVAASFATETPEGGKPMLHVVVTLAPDGDADQPRSIGATIALRAPQQPSNAGGGVQ
jgi:hypothetical protein